MTTAKYFSSAQSILPALSGQAGALKAILKACLVDGAGSQTVTINVASGVATVTFPTAHGMLQWQSVSVAGATPTALNGEATVLSTPSSTTLTYATTAANGSATGTITAKLASAGWQELFTGTNLTALKPTATDATGGVLRVDDTGTTTARVVGYGSMSDINTGVGPFPLTSQISGGGYWSKSGTSDSTVRPWFLVADSMGFYLAVSPQGTDRYTLYWFGDVASLKSGDVWRCMLSCDVTSSVSATAVPEGCAGYGGRTARAGAYIMRASSGIGASASVQRIGQGQNGSSADAYSGTSGYSIVGSGPNPANGGLLLTPLELIVTGSRGALPGLYHVRSDWDNTFASGTIVDGTDDMSGHKLLALRVAPPSGSVVAGTVFMDISSWSR